MLQVALSTCFMAGIISLHKKNLKPNKTKKIPNNSKKIPTTTNKNIVSKILFKEFRIVPGKKLTPKHKDVFK